MLFKCCEIHPEQGWHISVSPESLLQHHPALQAASLEFRFYNRHPFKTPYSWAVPSPGELRADIRKGASLQGPLHLWQHFWQRYLVAACYQVSVHPLLLWRRNVKKPNKVICEQIHIVQKMMGISLWPDVLPQPGKGGILDGEKTPPEAQKQQICEQLEGFPECWAHLHSTWHIWVISCSNPACATSHCRIFVLCSCSTILWSWLLKMGNADRNAFGEW